MDKLNTSLARSIILKGTLRALIFWNYYHFISLSIISVDSGDNYFAPGRIYSIHDPFTSQCYGRFISCRSGSFHPHICQYICVRFLAIISYVLKFYHKKYLQHSLGLPQYASIQNKCRDAGKEFYDHSHWHNTDSYHEHFVHVFSILAQHSPENAYLDSGTEEQRRMIRETTLIEHFNII